MGKKQIVTKKGGGMDAGKRARALARGSKKKLEAGVVSIEATFNNTKVALADMSGNVVAWSSSGALGFKGTRKGTPFAAAKVGELIADKAQGMGVKSVGVVIRGVGPGRESALRAFAAKNIDINQIKEMTPVPFNGPRPPKPRRG